MSDACDGLKWPAVQVFPLVICAGKMKNGFDGLLFNRRCVLLIILGGSGKVLYHTKSGKKEAFD